MIRSIKVFILACTLMHLGPVIGAQPILHQPVVKPLQTNTARLSTPLLVFSTGQTLKEPVKTASSRPQQVKLSCRVICSPYEPRQAITEISWPQQGSIEKLNDSRLRLDIIGAPSRFTDGQFGTVRISAIPKVKLARGDEIDIVKVKKLYKPALIQKVDQYRVMARDPALPSPEKLKLERIPNTKSNTAANVRQAISKDTESGAFGHMQVIARGTQIKRAKPQHNLILEGMQTGLSYRVRLISEDKDKAVGLGENICRVPVCPADFVTP